jgi:hypothetical protein
MFIKQVALKSVQRSLYNHHRGVRKELVRVFHSKYIINSRDRIDGCSPHLWAGVFQSGRKDLWPASIRTHLAECKNRCRPHCLVAICEKLLHAFLGLFASKVTEQLRDGPSNAGTLVPNQQND